MLFVSGLVAMRLLDLFCGGGGAAMGYHQAGFDEIVGVDIRPQPRYPFTFVQADALEYALEHGAEFDAIHASPPCQAYSSMKPFTTTDHPKLIAPVRELLIALGKPYFIENVEGAKREMKNPLTLCGTMFGLLVIRHRLFECNPPIYFAPAPHRHHLPVAKQGRWPKEDEEFICVTGSYSNQAYARRAMGIDWLKREEMAQAIPPAYTRYIGGVLLSQARPLTTPCSGFASPQVSGFANH